MQPLRSYINNKWRFLFTPMQNNSINQRTEKWFWVKGGWFAPLSKLTPKEHTHHRNTFLGALSKNSCFSDFAVDVLKEPKKKLKSTLHLYAQPTHPHLRRPRYIACWEELDVIKRSKFQVNRLRGFGATGPKMTIPIDLTYRPYNSVRINVLHCDFSTSLYSAGSSCQSSHR